MDKTLDCMGKGERQDNNERHRKVTFHSYWKFVKTTISDLLTKRYCIYVENSQKSDQFSNNLSTDTKGISLLEKCCYQTEYKYKDENKRGRSGTFNCQIPRENDHKFCYFLCILYSEYNLFINRII